MRAGGRRPASSADKGAYSRGMEFYRTGGSGTKTQKNRWYSVEYCGRAGLKIRPRGR